MRETIRNGVLTAAAGACGIGAFAPWVRSGASRRSSFDVFELVDRLGFAPGGWFEWALRPWPLVPLALVASVVAAWAGRARAAAGLAIVGGCYVAGIALGVRRAPDASLIRTDWGVTLSLIAAVALVASGCWQLTRDAN